MTDQVERGRWYPEMPAPGSDDEVRAIFVRLITFVATAKASHDAKNDALQCVEVLQSRML